MEEIMAYREELLSALEQVVPELSRLVADLPADRWHQPFDHDAHTAHYALFHLCALEAQFYAPQLPRILVEEHPVLQVFGDEAWMAEHYHTGEPVAFILGDFGRLRRDESGWLRNTAPTGWSRLARHPRWGEHTLQWWVEMQVDYSYQQLKKISSGINARQ